MGCEVGFLIGVIIGVIGVLIGVAVGSLAMLFLTTVLEVYFSRRIK